MHMNTFLRPLLAGSAALALLSGCTASSICNKNAQCQEEENDRDFSDDAPAVCAAEYDARIASLRANEEEECLRLADAIIALDNCRLSLDCDDFLEADLGGKCDDQLDDLEDARDDVDGDECSAQEN